MFNRHITRTLLMTLITTTKTPLKMSLLVLNNTRRITKGRQEMRTSFTQDLQLVKSIHHTKLILRKSNLLFTQSHMSNQTKPSL